MLTIQEIEKHVEAIRNACKAKDFKEASKALYLFGLLIQTEFEVQFEADAKAEIQEAGSGEHRSGQKYTLAHKLFKKLIGTTHASKEEFPDELLLDVEEMREAITDYHMRHGEEDEEKQRQGDFSTAKATQALKIGMVCLQEFLGKKRFEEMQERPGEDHFPVIHSYIDNIVKLQGNVLIQKIKTIKEKQLFHPATQDALREGGVKHPGSSFLSKAQLFKNNMVTSFLTQDYSDELFNQYNRLNQLIDHTLHIINSYQAKKPIDLDKLREIAALANSLQAICELPPNAINSDTVPEIIKKLNVDLSMTYDHILRAEKSKSRLPGFVTRLNDSILRNITKALKEDKKLMPKPKEEESTRNTLK